MTPAPRNPSLTAQTVVTLVAFQAFLSIAIPLGSVGFWMRGLEDERRVGTEIMQAVAEGLSLGPDRALRPVPLSVLERIARPGAEPWVVVAVGDRSVSAGRVPPSGVAALLDAAHGPEPGRVERLASGTLALAERRETALGTATVAVGGIEMGRWDFADFLMLNLLDGWLWFLLPVSIGTVALVLLLARGLLGRVRAISRAAGAIDPERRGHRLPVQSVPRELLPLVEAVNDALARLDEGHERQGRFVANAAHELRTPIAILRTRLEALGDSPLKERLRHDARRLSALSASLLEVERARRAPPRDEPVELAALAREVAADLAPGAVEAGYEMALEAPPEPVTASGDPTEVRRALTNLVTNAIEHGGGCGTISIHVTHPATVAVHDEGPGIPAEHRERVFDPFHRLAEDGAGAGLGLTVVREIADAHGGFVTIEDTLQGTYVTIRLKPVRAAALKWISGADGSGAIEA